MAAGLGFKTFTTGEVLTAADTNGYLMQGINVFASTAARDAAITSPQEGQFAFTKDTNGLWYYDGAAWVASGATGDIEGVTAGVGITGGGTSGTVTITNDMATTITAAGDIVVGTGSGTYDNLPIGTTAQVLTADTTVSPYKVKWATPATASSGFVFINSTSFSNVASVNIDSVFTSTYETYYVDFIDVYATTQTDDFLMQLRYGSTTETSAAYYGSWVFWNPATDAINGSRWRAATSHTICSQVGGSGALGHGNLYISKVGVAGRPSIWGSYGNSTIEANQTSSTIYDGTSQVYSGFLLKSSSTNITGTVRVYGLAKS